MTSSPVRFGHRRLQRRRRQRLPRVGGHPGARRGRAVRHRRQPQLSRSPPPARAAGRAASSGCITRSSTPRELERPEYRANPVNRCYYCKHELYTALSALARDRGLRRHCRRQQCRRSRRLPAGPAGGARVRRPQPARRSGADQERYPRAVAPRRPADVGRAGVGVPVVAHSVPLRGDRREAAHDRARRRRRPQPGFRVCRVRHHDDLARLEIGAAELPRALEPDVQERMVAGADRDRLSARHDRPAGI